MRTQVAIIGAGPAGLLLGHLLRAEGIECIVLERRSPDYVLGRIRAGVLERITVSLMERLGLDARLKDEGLPHDGFNLADGERLIRIDMAALTGKHVVVYGQTELTRDLMRDTNAVAVLHERDRVKYGQPTGPTFEQLFNKEKLKPKTSDEQAWQAIIGSSQRHNKSVSDAAKGN